MESWAGPGNTHTHQVDDGSGVIPCCQWRKEEDSEEGLVIPQLGQLVSVYGRVSEYREERQVKVNAICIEEDPNIEPLHWLEAGMDRYDAAGDRDRLFALRYFSLFQRQSDAARIRRKRRKTGNRLDAMDRDLQRTGPFCLVEVAAAPVGPQPNVLFLSRGACDTGSVSRKKPYLRSGSFCLSISGDSQ